MRVNHVSAHHFRSFEELRIELRPLTLFYGENSSGKSSLLRLLPLIGGSLGPGAPGQLDLAQPAARGASFENFIGKKWAIDEGKRFSLGAEWDDGLAVRWGLGFERDRETLLDLFIERGAEKIHFAHAGSDHHSDQSVDIATLELEHLRPRQAPGLLGEMSERLGTLINRVQYLGPTRAAATSSPVLGKSWQPETTINPDGDNALHALSKDNDISREVERFFREHCGRTLQKAGTGERELWTVAPVARPEFSIPLADAGVGVGQLLPELVTLALRRSPSRPRGFSIFALEEPATHLHERLQISLASHLAAIAAEPDPVTLLIETHSRPLLTGIQLAIAQGKLDPSRVALYWVEQDSEGTSLPRKITFDRRGFPEGDHLLDTFQAETIALADLADLALGKGF